MNNYHVTLYRRQCADFEVCASSPAEALQIADKMAIEANPDYELCDGYTLFHLRTHESWSSDERPVDEMELE